MSARARFRRARCACSSLSLFGLPAILARFCDGCDAGDALDDEGDADEDHALEDEVEDRDEDEEEGNEDAEQKEGEFANDAAGGPPCALPAGPRCWLPSRYRMYFNTDAGTGLLRISNSACLFSSATCTTDGRGERTGREPCWRASGGTAGGGGGRVGRESGWPALPIFACTDWRSLLAEALMRGGFGVSVKRVL